MFSALTITSKHTMFIHVVDSKLLYINNRPVLYSTLNRRKLLVLRVEQKINILLDREKKEKGRKVIY